MIVCLNVAFNYCVEKCLLAKRLNNTHNTASKHVNPQSMITLLILFLSRGQPFLLSPCHVILLINDQDYVESIRVLPALPAPLSAPLKISLHQ